jgi:hypothetical protein
MSESNAAKYMVTVPIREVAAGLNLKGRTNPTFTYMSNKQYPGCNIYLELAWIYEMPEPRALVPKVHSHAFDQVTLNIGSDFQHPEYLGAEIESYIGGEKYVCDKTAAFFLPKGVEHGQVTWTKFKRPHIQMSIMLGTGDFQKANPGGRL